MSSENPSSGDNQQETASNKVPLDPWWIVGFVDGEGCFSVSIHRNPKYARRTRGWQVNPVFQVYQHEQHGDVLEEIQRYFGCGRISSKGPKSSVLTLSVGGRKKLEGIIIPFFERYPLRIKRADFNAFATIVRSMREREHYTDKGFERIVRLAYSMNENGKQRARSLDDILVGSSETVRQARLDLN
jgi:hypothetical protein